MVNLELDIILDDELIGDESKICVFLNQKLFVETTNNKNIFKGIVPINGDRDVLIIKRSYLKRKTNVNSLKRVMGWIVAFLYMSISIDEGVNVNYEMETKIILSKLSDNPTLFIVIQKKSSNYYDLVVKSCGCVLEDKKVKHRISLEELKDEYRERKQIIFSLLNFSAINLFLISILLAWKSAMKNLVFPVLIFMVILISCIYSLNKLKNHFKEIKKEIAN